MDIAIKLTSFVCVIWYIAATVAVALPCIPVQKTWEPQTWTPIPGLPKTIGHCYSYNEFYLGIGLPNCILDFWVVAMPILKIRQLQLPLRYKISISLIFVFAGLYVLLICFEILANNNDSVGLITIIRIVLIYPITGRKSATRPFSTTTLTAIL